MIVSLIVAVGDNGVIGTDDGMPWRLPSDLKRFRQLTLGKPILMGRKTAALLGRALPERYNVVLTHSPDVAIPGMAVAHGVDEALKLAQDYLTEHGGDEVMVIGGEVVYRQFLDRCDRLYLTRVHGTFAGTAFFPLELLDQFRWQVQREETSPADDRNSHAHTFTELHRIRDA